MDTLELEITFYKLVNQWLEETKGISSSTELINHSAYQQIIKMGPVIIPLLLKELESQSGRWFYALTFITGVNPVSLKDRGNTQAMIRAWLIWGLDNNYI